MNGGIFLIQNDGRLSEMKEQPYKSEGLLQELLAKYPNLLAGDQMDNAAPRRWLLISREMGLASEEDGGDRWSIDHLFLDQDAIPTIVEVKRSSDSRIRREVVGQVLDYAANCVKHWPIDLIRARLVARCELEKKDPNLLLSEFLGEGAGPEVFWQKAKVNLEIGRIRLVFVADVIPPELQSIVEFLNKQMTETEVLAVEIKQFVGEGLKTLVPRVIGLTSEAQQKKSASKPNKQWDEAAFFSELKAKHGEETANTARQILEWAKPRTTEVWFGAGKNNGSFVPIISHGEERHQLFAVWTYAVVEIYFYWYAYKPTAEPKRNELLIRLNQIKGVSIPPDAINKRPSIPLSVLKDKAALRQFLECFDWFIAELKKPKV